MALEFDLERVLLNVRGAETDDLLDRLTVYGAELEPDVLPLIERELHERGVTQAQIDAHRRDHEGKVLRRPDGTAVTCSFCRRPAQEAGWRWHKLWGKVPLFPRWFAHCAEHLGKK